MTPEFEQLMAYVDGELDAPERARFEQAMATDPTLARSVAAQRALRARLLQSLDQQLSEPVPGQLLRAARSAPAASSPVVSLSAWRTRAEARPQAARLRALSVALAASVVLAGVLGVALWRSPGAGGLALQGGQLIASGTIARTLSTVLVRAQPANAAVSIGLSFRDHAGHWCRTFMVRAQQSAALACRAGADWVIESVAAAPAGPDAGSELRMAGSAWPAALMQQVGQRMEGEALDAAGEERARARDWRP
jgi:hypothetical protein